jgi:DNA polymerase-4
MSVRAIWGVGPALGAKLVQDGLHTIADLQKADATTLARRYGEAGLRLSRLCNGIDARAVNPIRETKSVSAETTFNTDIADAKALQDALWPLCEKAAARMKEKKLAGRVITLKLKTASFQTVTRRTALATSTNLARDAFETARPLLTREADGRAFRLIGVGFSELETSAVAAQSELFPTPQSRRRREEDAIDRIRAKFGADAIALGRALPKKNKEPTEKE